MSKPKADAAAPPTRRGRGSGAKAQGGAAATGKKRGRKPMSNAQRLANAKKRAHALAKALSQGKTVGGKKIAYPKYSGRKGGTKGTAAQRQAAKAAGDRRRGKGIKRRGTTAKTPAGIAHAAAVRGPNGQAIRDHDSLRKYIRNNPGKGKADWQRMRKERAKNKAARAKQAAASPKRTTSRKKK